MIFIQGVLVVLVVVGFMFWSSRAQVGKTPGSANKPAVTSEKVQSMSREDIKRELKKNETQSPPPEKMGAPCYGAPM